MHPYINIQFLFKRSIYIVGSSFGGAVVTYLLSQNSDKHIFADPPPKVVILCSAHKYISKYCEPGLKSVLENPDISRWANDCLIVHGKYDKTVPVSDSDQLVENNRIQRYMILDDDHRFSRFFNVRLIFSLFSQFQQ